MGEENKSTGDAMMDVKGVKPGERPKAGDIVSGLFPNKKVGSAPGIIGPDGRPMMSESQRDKLQAEIDKAPKQMFKVTGDLVYDPALKESVWVQNIWMQNPRTKKMIRALELPVPKSGLKNIIDQMEVFEKDMEKELKENKKGKNG